MDGRKTKYVKIRKQNANQFIISIPAWLAKKMSLNGDEMCEVIDGEQEMDTLIFKIVNRFRKKEKNNNSNNKKF